VRRENVWGRRDRLDEKRAFRINEFCAAYGLGRTKTYELIKAGKLRTVLVGGRRLIPKDEAEALLAEGA
jgi:excisionase family DNA binding protein